MLERRHEPGVRRVHPRQFVEENDLAAATARQGVRERTERGDPGRGRRTLRSEGPPHRIGERLQLVLHAAFGKPSVLEGKPVAERLADEKRLAHASPAVDRDEFGPSRTERLFERPQFFVAPDERLGEFNHHFHCLHGAGIYNSFCGKSTKNRVSAKTVQHPLRSVVEWFAFPLPPSPSTLRSARARLRRPQRSGLPAPADFTIR